MLSSYSDLPSCTSDSVDINPVVYNNDTLLYLINFEGQGWMVVSGDKRTEPILAYNNSVQEVSLDDVSPGVFTWLDDKADEIYYLKTTNDTTISITDFWADALPDTTYIESSIHTTSADADGNTSYTCIKTLVSSSTSTTSSTVGPYIETKWDQHDPFNQCVPRISASSSKRCLAGCVAIATAQLMYFGHYNGGNPSWMYSAGSCSEYSVDEDTYSYSFSFSNASTTVWDKMAIKDLSSNSSASEKYTSILIGYVGYKLGMSYSEDESGASSEDVPGLLDDFGIDCTYESYSYSDVISSLNSGIPVYMSAKAGRKDHKLLGVHLYYTYYDGHAWIIDGYEAETTKTTKTYLYKYYRNGSEITSKRKTTTSTSTSTSTYYIMNWGWDDGSYDSGRYLATSSSFTVAGYTFKYKKHIICDIDFE